MAWPDTIFKWLGHARYNSTPPTLTNANVGELQCDASGRLYVTSQGASPAGYSRTVVPTYRAVARNQAASFVELWGFNDGSATRYLQLHNVAAFPSDGVTPVEVFRVPAGGTISIAPTSPVAFTTGITWVISSTPGTLTTDSSATFAITIAYL